MKVQYIHQTIKTLQIGLFCLLAILYSVFSATKVVASVSHKDTIRCYDVRSASVVFLNKKAESCLSRIYLGKPAELLSLGIWLGGQNQQGKGRVRIIGYEGGGSLPLQERDLTSPIVFAKTKRGSERIILNLEKQISIHNDYFYVVVDSMDSGVYVLSDTTSKTPLCHSNELGSYYQQMIKLRGQGWSYCPYSFKIDVITESPSTPSVLIPRFHTDTSTITREYKAVGSQRTIAVSDVNHDSYSDLLINGYLFINKRGGRFELASSSPDFEAIRGGVSCFVDMNRDGFDDIIYLGGKGTAGENNSVVYLNDRTGKFQRSTGHILPHIHPSISTFSIGDLNNDGYNDLFIGNAKILPEQTTPDVLTGSNKTNTGGHGFALYLNDGSGRFVDATEKLSLSLGTDIICSAASILDVDNDNSNELFIRADNKSVVISLKNDGLLQTQQVASGADELGGTSLRAGCYWNDFNNDGVADVFLPGNTTMLSKESISRGGGSVVFRANQLQTNQDYHLDFDEYQSGGVGADFNNDGLIDVLTGTSCRCNGAKLYLRQHDGEYYQATLESGVGALDDTHDMVAVDVNNDGALDIVGISRDSVVVLLQESRVGNYVSIDIQDKSTETVEGTKLTLFSDNTQQSKWIVSGRGLTMQDSKRFHFGLSEKGTVDSVLVNWNNGKAEIFRDITLNSSTTLRKGSGIATSDNNNSLIITEVVPNPFSDELAFTLLLQSDSHIKLEVFDGAGNKVAEVMNDMLHKGEQHISWNGRSQDGSPLASGIYVYKITSAFGVLTGNVVKNK